MPSAVYVILYACQIMCAQPSTITFVSPTSFADKVAAANDARTCDPDVLVTADRAIAEKALESNLATVFKVDRKLKVYKLKREAVFHVEETEQAAPSAPGAR